MKIIVIGGTGLIGSKLVTRLNAVGHEAVAASPNSGVNTLTGEGLAEGLKGAQVSDDVVSALFEVATSSPLNGAIEIAGPEAFRFDELIRQQLRALNDSREVVADPQARYFGTELSERSIVPGDNAQLGETHFEDWLSSSASQLPPQPQPATAASINPAASKKDEFRENEFRTGDVPPGSALLEGEVVVFNVGGSLCATQAKGTHRQGPLNEGKLDGS